MLFNGVSCPPASPPPLHHVRAVRPEGKRKVERVSTTPSPSTQMALTAKKAKCLEEIAFVSLSVLRPEPDRLSRPVSAVEADKEELVESADFPADSPSALEERELVEIVHTYRNQPDEKQPKKRNISPDLFKKLAS